VAQILHRICQDLKLPSYIKTSGATGLHILLPLGRQYSHEEARNFARILALLGVNADPDLSTISRPLRSRARKVYIDFGQNGYGRTIVSPFSVRPLPGAPASCPLRWEEVKAGLDPQKFTITTLSRRFSKIPDPLAAVLKDGIDIGIALNLIAGKV
jgi:bifunctional non-homologous end joining protein LigD